MSDIKPLWQVLKDALLDEGTYKKFHYYIFPRQQYRVSTNLEYLYDHLAHVKKINVAFVVRRNDEVHDRSRRRSDIDFISSRSFVAQMLSRPLDVIIIDGHGAIDPRDLAEIHEYAKAKGAQIVHVETA